MKEIFDKFNTTGFITFLLIVVGITIPTLFTWFGKTYYPENFGPDDPFLITLLISTLFLCAVVGGSIMVFKLIKKGWEELYDWVDGVRSEIKYNRKQRK